MVEWIKKNKDWLTAIAGVGSFIVVLSLMGILFQNNDSKKEEEKEEIQIVEKVDLTVDSESENETYEAPQTASFFLKPSAAELMEKFTEMDPHEFKTQAKKLPGLRIMWPTYYFSTLKDEADITTILLDTTEDGFGVTISCTINSSKYPKLQHLQRGDKLWVAGEILGVDTEGVGQIFIAAEHLRFAGDVNWPQKLNTELEQENQ